MSSSKLANQASNKRVSIWKLTPIKCARCTDQKSSFRSIFAIIVWVWQFRGQGSESNFKKEIQWLCYIGQMEWFFMLHYFPHFSSNWGSHIATRRHRLLQNAHTHFTATRLPLPPPSSSSGWDKNMWWVYSETSSSAACCGFPFSLGSFPILLFELTRKLLNLHFTGKCTAQLRAMTRLMRRATQKDARKFKLCCNAR